MKFAINCRFRSYPGGYVGLVPMDSSGAQFAKLRLKTIVTEDRERCPALVLVNTGRTLHIGNERNDLIEIKPIFRWRWRE